MAESQRSAFRANLNQLTDAISANNDAAAKESVTGLASLVFHNFDRIADALERIADAEERAARSTWHTTRFAGAIQEEHPAPAAARERQARGGIGP